MKIETLEAKIAARADREAQQAVRAFRLALAIALDRLFGGKCDGSDRVKQGYAIGLDPRPGYGRDAKLVLDAVLSSDPKKGWPGAIWRNRENAIREEVLSTMDALQRTLVSDWDQSEDACTAAEEGGAA